MEPISKQDLRQQLLAVSGGVVMGLGTVSLGYANNDPLGESIVVALVALGIGMPVGYYLFFPYFVGVYETDPESCKEAALALSPAEMAVERETTPDGTVVKVWDEDPDDDQPDAYYSEHDARTLAETILEETDGETA